MNMNKFLGLNSFSKKADGSEMTHREQYETVANAIGLDKLIRLVPAPLADVKKALAEGEGHLNEIPLRLWDSRHDAIKSLVAPIIGERTDYKTITFHWSLSQSVSLLKTAAKMWAEKEVEA